MTGIERGATARQSAVDIRRLRWLGFGLPIAFLVIIEAFRFLAVETDPEHAADHVAIAAIEAIAILVFAALMFRLIDRAELQVLRQNRELTAINAVSTSVQGELGVEQIIDAALDVVIERTGATEASVVVFARDGASVGLERRVVHGTHVSGGAMGAQMPHLVEIPLAHGTSIVGRMRLHLAADTLEPDLLTAATLNNIGHQLACSVEIGQLIGDLQRREAEDRGLYDVLLRISNQKPLAETIDALARHALDQLDAEMVEVCITPQVIALLDPTGHEPPQSLTPKANGGAALVVRQSDAIQGPHASERTARMSLVSPELTFGELCVATRGDRPLNDREWRFLHRTAELAVIAISSARMREREHQVAILAERERLAREMHDSLAQVLGYIHLQLVALRPKVGRAEPRVIAASLAELVDVAEDAYRDVREAILGLRESSRAGRSLLENLRAYIERYQHQAGIEATFESDFEEPPQLSPQAEIHVIRVIQEALTNVRKHAHAKRAAVRATSEYGIVVFSVEDDGRGFEVSTATIGREGGFGLEAMRERMELIGGTLTIDSAPGRGTRVVARVPMLRATPAVEENESHALV